MMLRSSVVAIVVVGLIASSGSAQEFEVLWQVGLPDDGWPVDGVGGGPEADFVQEAGVNDPPGDPMSPAVNQQADDDYYFAGEYPTPIGTVAEDEIAMERAFAGEDNNLRIHFNLPEDTVPVDRYRFSTQPFNLDGNGETPMYGLSVAAGVGTDRTSYVEVLPEVVIGNDDLGSIVTTPVFQGGDVGWEAGPGVDNVLEVRGTNMSASGGGNWMGLDFHRLERQAPIEVPALSDLAILVLALGLIHVGAFVIRRKRAAPQAA